MEELDNLVGYFKRTGFVLGCENWDRYDFEALLRQFCIINTTCMKNKL